MLSRCRPGHLYGLIDSFCSLRTSYPHRKQQESNMDCIGYRTKLQIKIKSIFVYLMENSSLPRLSQTQKWFTGCYSMNNVTQTDIRNKKNIVLINKNIEIKIKLY